jgi:nucleoside-diphosphate-sugar epimerase
LRILVTGAGGFLGRHVVTALLRRGHAVRALVRPSSWVDSRDWVDRAEVVRADLRAPGPLATAFEGVDVLAHLAARVGGNESAQMSDTVVGTERLLEAMARSATRRLVLASSFSVYDWSAVRGTLTEESPLESDFLYRRDGYAIAKTWQERITRRMSREHGWDLTVLRPGFIWGRDHEYLAGIGQKVGQWHLVFGPSTRLPLTHVENCADCFAEAVENPRAVGETFNVVDGHDLSSWRYLGEYLRHGEARARRIPVPYAAALSAALLAEWVNRWFCEGRARLPGLMTPCRFRARFKPLSFSTRKLREVLGWHPPLDLAECLRRTYDPDSAAWLPASASPPQLHPELPQCLNRSPSAT